jgi:hypothetical protein
MVLELYEGPEPNGRLDIGVWGGNASIVFPVGQRELTAGD